MIAFAMLIASFDLVPLIGTSFLQSSGDKGATIEVAYPAGTSQESTLEDAARVEQLVHDAVEVESIQTQVGGEGLQAVFLGSNDSTANMTVTFDGAAAPARSLAGASSGP